MSYRCTNAFAYGDRVFPGGVEVADDDPILETHAANFSQVADLRPATETATAAPGSVRHHSSAKKPQAKPQAKPAGDAGDKTAADTATTAKTDGNEAV